MALSQLRFNQGGTKVGWRRLQFVGRKLDTCLCPSVCLFLALAKLVFFFPQSWGLQKIVPSLTPSSVLHHIRNLGTGTFPSTGAVGSSDPSSQAFAEDARRPGSKLGSPGHLPQHPRPNNSNLQIHPNPFPCPPCPWLDDSFETSTLGVDLCPFCSFGACFFTETIGTFAIPSTLVLGGFVGGGNLGALWKECSYTSGQGDFDKTRKCVPTLTQTVSFKQKEIWDTTTSVRDGMPQIQNREHFTGKLDSATFWLALQDEALVTVPHSKCLRLYVQPRHCLVSYPSFLTLVVLASPLQSSTTSRPIDQGRKR